MQVRKCKNEKLFYEINNIQKILDKMNKFKKKKKYDNTERDNFPQKWLLSS